MHRFTNAQIHVQCTMQGFTKCTHSLMHNAEIHQMHGFTNAQCRDSPNARIHQCTDSPIHEFTNAQCRDSPMHGFTNAQIHQYRCSLQLKILQHFLDSNYKPLPLDYKGTAVFPPFHYSESLKINLWIIIMVGS